MHPNQYRQRLFASMTSGPLVVFAPDEPAEADPAPADPEAGNEDPDLEPADPEASADPEPADPEADPAPEEEPKPKRVPWQVKRIDTETARRKAAETEREQARKDLEEAQRQLAAMKVLYGDGAPAGGDAPPPPASEHGKRVYTEEELAAEVDKRAAERLHTQTLNQKMESMYHAGKGTYGADFDANISRAVQAFPDLGTRADLFNALSDLPNGADVYNQLTNDLDRMADVLEMTPLKLGMELARMSQEVKKPTKAPPSRVPAPIDPIERGGNTPADDSIEGYAKDFDARRNKRREARG